MFSRPTQNVFTDLLFNLLFAFVILFILSFWMMAKQNEDEQNKNSNKILVTMRWKTDNDIDLWMQLPDGRRVGYSSREAHPIYLDIDIVRWQKFEKPDGSEYIIENNEEVITIRDILDGEYVINTHYYSAGGVKPDTPTDVEIIVYDVQNKKMVFAGNKTISRVREETHFLKFTINSYKVGGRLVYNIDRVYTDRPSYFVGDKSNTSGAD